MKSATEIVVRYAETDKMGIVYHANYLIWFEVARTEFLNKLGFPYEKLEEKGIMSPVIKVDIDYGKSFTYGDTAVVYTYISKNTPVRTEYSYEVYEIHDNPETDKPRVSGKTLHCLVDATTFKPLSIKRSAPELYQAYEEALIKE